MHFNFLFQNSIFEPNFVWAPMVQVHRVKKTIFILFYFIYYYRYHECFVLIAIKSVWSNNDEHNIHDIKRLLPSLSLVHYKLLAFSTSKCSKYTNSMFKAFLMISRTCWISCSFSRWRSFESINHHKDSPNYVYYGVLDG